MTSGVSSAAENTAALLQAAAHAGLAMMIPGALEPRARHPRSAVSPGQEVVAAQGAVLDRVLDGRTQTMSDGLERRAYGRFHAARTKTPWGERYQRTFALVEGTAILASAERYRLAGVLNGRAVQVCGIGSLWTEPSARGVGHAQRLIDALLDTAATEGAEMALLFRQAGADDGGRNGFQELPLTDLTLRVTESSRRGAPMTMMRAGEEYDLAAIAAMGRVRAGPFRFHLDRDVDFIRHAITSKRLLAGLGSTNNSFVSSETLSQCACALSRSPCFMSARTAAKVAVSRCADSRMAPSAPSVSAL